MKKSIKVLSYDIGTTGVKTCLFGIGESIELLKSASAGYELYVLPNGGVEQEPDDWWNAMRETTRGILESSGVSPETIDGISFCSQMQGLVLVDRDGVPVRRAMSYMDQRAQSQLDKGLAYGLQIAGANVVKLLKSLRITGAVAASVKDPVWKYKWVEENEPHNFSRTYKWLDVKESMICRMTGEFIATPDSAFAALIYDIRKGKEGFSADMCKLLGVNPDHLPRIIGCDEQAGKLTKKAADDLGLAPGIPVFGGGGDASLIGIGAGAVAMNDTHVYWGTSGWVGTVVDKSIVDAGAMIAAIVGAQKDRFNYFAELETAGKCLEWARDKIVLNEIRGIEPTEVDKMYSRMTQKASEAAVGSGRVIFTPWLHGNRCPFEAPEARGMFFNISLETNEKELTRAVVEGVCYHLRWFIETQEKKVKTSEVVRFAGGGAVSDLICQILSDCTGRVVETVKSPQTAGSVGAAVLVAVGLGVIGSVADCKKLIRADKTFSPNTANKAVYDETFAVYKKLYKANKANFKKLNGIKD
ncbi:MAG: FGGY-family carbohydrate kinase [Oscillospiraceae bacterium]|nr:FGGY-family carbohydrate kinase [Oscillospiraceae bacterium]